MKKKKEKGTKNEFFITILLVENAKILVPDKL